MPAQSYTLTPSWQKVASYGQAVEVDNVSSSVVYFTTSSSGIPSASDGLPLSGTDNRRNWILMADLYGRTDTGNAKVVVMTDVRAG